MACSRALDDETAATALGFWTRARAFFAGHGITVERVLTDSGSPLCHPCLADRTPRLAIRHTRTAFAGVCRSGGAFRRARH